ncbi:MAG: UDP-N-acetylmuramoyl-L-alanine--D-glutamate ligase [Firmicutes bacterium]|nr:UDP-N-acetylmuramoyl-L-alanine--D-glutamate ligase [Bacillota bacterium]
MEYENKKVLVCGLAKSGAAAAILLKKHGADVTAQDMKTEELLGELPTELGGMGINLILGRNPDDEVLSFDMLVMSPGVPLDLPFINKAREAGKKIIGETELGFLFTRSPFIGITGTNGKTTTTTLVGEIMRNAGRLAGTVGNIGTPLTECAEGTSPEDWFVAELSSFQLETIETFRPKVSAMLNITPDHLNRHKTLENYILAKERVFENQTAEDFTILNYNDPATKDMANRTKAKVVFFSLDKALDEGVYSDEKSMYIKCLGYDEKVIDIDEMNIIGGHNVENAMAAIACSVCAGVSLDVIRKTLREFVAVEHRIEFVREVNGVKYYNDSKGTNPDASIKAVMAMKSPICLIAGGYDKGSDFEEWIDTFKGRVKYVAVIGAVKEKICETLDKAGFTNYERADDFNQAMEFCTKNAVKGDCVLLSPACASWDMFKSYEQRGHIFKDYVNSLEEN